MSCLQSIKKLLISARVRVCYRCAFRIRSQMIIDYGRRAGGRGGGGEEEDEEAGTLS